MLEASIEGYRPRAVARLDAHGKVHGTARICARAGADSQQSFRNADGRRGDRPIDMSGSYARQRRTSDAGPDARTLLAAVAAPACDGGLDGIGDRGRRRGRLSRGEGQPHPGRRESAPRPPPTSSPDCSSRSTQQRMNELQRIANHPSLRQLFEHPDNDTRDAARARLEPDSQPRPSGSGSVERRRRMPADDGNAARRRRRAAAWLDAGSARVSRRCSVVASRSSVRASPRSRPTPATATTATGPRGHDSVCSSCAVR